MAAKPSRPAHGKQRKTIGTGNVVKALELGGGTERLAQLWKSCPCRRQCPSRIAWSRFIAAKTTDATHDALA